LRFHPLGVAPSRWAELAKLDVKNMSMFSIYRIRQKDFKQGKQNKPIEFREYTEDPCTMSSRPIKHLFRKDSTYTRWSRKNTTGDNRFFWIITIDNNSKRTASISKAFSKGANINDILKMKNWSNKYVWQKYYHKEFSAVEKYQDTLLG